MDKYYRRKCESYQQMANKKMTKSAKIKPRKAISTRKGRKTKKGQTKADQYVGYLVELHKLQGALLTELHREV
jgi:hypothetical protein